MQCRPAIFSRFDSVRTMCGALIAAHSLLGAVLPAQTRLTRTFAHEDGLIAPPVWALAQDSTGFIWVGTQAGLFRYDGNRFRRWLPNLIDAAVISIVVSPRGRIAAHDEQGGIVLLDSLTAHRLPEPPGSMVRQQRLLAFDSDERLWTVRDGQALFLERGAWHQIPGRLLGNETAQQVQEAGGGAIFVTTDRGIWRVDPPEIRRVASLRQVVDLLPLPGAQLLALTFDSRLHVIRDGVPRVLLPVSALRLEPPFPRGIALVRRQGTVWLALDRYLVAFRDHDAAEVLGSDEGIQGGGPLLVDREGSLWMGTFSGLVQFPEPETRLWNDDHGLPSRHTRFVARSESTLWVGTWQGAGYITRDSVGWRSRRVSDTWGNPMCSTDDGALWTAGTHGLLQLRDTQIVATFPPPIHVFGCARASDGQTWLATTRGLWLAGRQPVPPTRMHNVPALAGDSLVESVYEGADGRLWIATAGEVCSASAAAVRAGTAVEWQCERLGDTGKNTSMIQPVEGSLWMSTMRLGLLSRRHDGWHSVPQNDSLATRAVFRLVSSNEDGLWMIGHGILQRVRPESPDGWRILEQPSAWHGVPTIGGQDLLEDHDGTLWITTSLGVVQVPPAARFDTQPAPRMQLVDARIDDESVALHSALELPHSRNRLELEFAALSYRDRSLLRYQLRMSPASPWTEVRDQPTFRWVDLQPGAYRPEVRASLDGHTWSGEPASFEFTVLPPWYRSPPALIAFTALLAFVLWTTYRLRMAYLLGLERQRTRIAMDLHDEVGSGLGSIGILSGLLATNGVDHNDGRALAAQIARATEELGSSLEDIIWSLDPRVETLEELMGRLVEHGGRLFAEGEVEFVTELPDRWPDGSLPLTIRRNVLLIGLEALHNAARHADPRLVQLTMRRDGDFWCLMISDDGGGITEHDRRRSQPGRGLGGMQRRATEIGAELCVTSHPGAGTTVAVRFSARMRRWRLPLRKRSRFA